MKLKLSLVIIGVVLMGLVAKGQNFAAKTNVLYDASSTVNLGFEFGIAPQWTMDLSGNYNGWSTTGDVKWKHSLFQPEARYWLCDRFSGHFFGLHAIGQLYEFADWDMDFNFLGTDFSQLKGNRYNGWAVGAGLAYGYDFVLGKHWNFEVEFGFGYIYSQYDQYQCGGRAEKVVEAESHNYVGPTKAAVNLVYLF